LHDGALPRRPPSAFRRVHTAFTAMLAGEKGAHWFLNGHAEEHRKT
jgi:hypothetical protein